MKKVFLLLLIASSVRSMAQTPPGWTKVNFSYNYVGVGADNNMIVPRYSAAPTIRGGYFGAGQLGCDTVGHVLYFYSGGSWRALGVGQWTTTGSDIYYNTGGVGVGATSVNSRSILELTSTTKGFLMPRMNTTQQTTISSPPSGLIIYNTDSLAFMYYNGTSWIKVGTGTGGGAADGRGNDSLTFKDEGVSLGTKGSVKVFNTVGQSILTTRWSDSITVFGSSNYSGLAQKTNTLINQKYYDAFPAVAWDPITFATASVSWKSSGDHAGPGPALISYSHDGFSTFTPPDTIKLNGTNLTDINTISLGRGNKTRWVILYQRGCCATNAINFARDDEEDETFSAGDSLVLAAYTWVAPYGDVLQIHGDTLYGLAYGLKVAQSQTTAFYIKSYDNGVTWSYGTDIVYGGTLNANAMPSETSMAIISGTQVSNTKLLCIVRDDFYGGYHNEVTSADGGATWTSHFNSEGEWAFKDKQAGLLVQLSWPVSLIVRDGIIYAVHGIRRQASGGGYHLRLFKGNALDCFNSVNNWNLKFTTSYRGLAYYVTGGDKDFGYFKLYPSPTGELRTIFYDENTFAGLTTPYTNLKSMPLINNMYEAYNDANQSVTTATETTVTFPNQFFDDQLYYNSDSSKIYAASDGYYVIDVHFTIDTSGLGTYRQAKLKVVNPGQEYEGGAGAVSTRIISQVTYQPSNDSKFCWVELHGQGYLRKGEEIRVTFKHDKGSSLNLLNTIADTNIDGGGARIKIKKID